MDARLAPQVLLVEDDVRSAGVLARMLREDGFEVEVVRDGAAAIARLSRAPLPSLLLLDLQLPHAGGLAVARYARSLDATLPVILTTGYPELAPTIVRELKPPPLLRVKPFDYSALRRDIQDLLQMAIGAPSVR